MFTTLPPALYASHAGLWIADDAGVRSVGRGDALGRASQGQLILLNAPLTAQRLGYPELNGLDVLELFAFIHPAQFMVPTIKGLAIACGLTPPQKEEEAAGLLRDAVGVLLARLKSTDWQEGEGAYASAQALFRLRWPWADMIVDQIARPKEDERWLFSRLPEWEEAAGRPQPRTVVVEAEEALNRLSQLAGDGAETRQGQRDYATAATVAFAPRDARNAPHVLLAEAGTGIGKTLGYLSPASLWSEKSGGAVWISTYTKALQRQLTHETARLGRPKGKIVVRKGRENYLCLLNLEDALQGGFAGRAAILAQLVARWASYTRDGDMVGGDLPGWLPILFRRNGSTALTDRRGECVYAGCPHYRKCFIERASRASAAADLVIANHALVMVNAARGREEATRPTRYVFDEGHHLFDAADSMFSIALTGQEMIELRRWIIGPESKSRGRRRGLAARLADVASYDHDGGAAINAAVAAAQAMPSDGWLQRINEGAPFGVLEQMLAAVRGVVYARANGDDAGYGLETVTAQLTGPFLETIEPAIVALDHLVRPMVVLGQRLEAVMADAPDWLDGQARARVEGALASLSWRVDTVSSWLGLLARLGGPTDPDFVDWMVVDRFEGREMDIGLRRHWLDPMQPFAKTVLEPAHGVLITSATLKGSEDWATADARSGARLINAPVHHFEAQSPFDYTAQAEVLIVTDIPRGDLAALANGYARLIAASKGGVLGLFTAIRRLRQVHARIVDALARDGLPLYAQHVDPMDTGTLVDIFRDDPSASLLGTDALRDGVDVPGQSLRLVVMEGIPWPKPTVLHAARKEADGGSAYDDRIVRARLAQAFGRLIRRAGDKGQFVMMSAACPSRLLTAFPVGTPIRRVSLDEAVAAVSDAALHTSALHSQEKLGQEERS
jgi:ATP-dependent DNA helicase DinG